MRKTRRGKNRKLPPKSLEPNGTHHDNRGRTITSTTNSVVAFVSRSRMVSMIVAVGVVALFLNSVVQLAFALSQPPPMVLINDHSEGLSTIYRSIATKTLDVESWPDSSKFCSLLPKDERGIYHVPTFPQGDAPLAVAAILDRNPGARQITQQCDEVFAQFCEDLYKIISTTKGTRSDSLESTQDFQFWKIPPGTHHITVAVFQEHPSLLHDQADKDRWRPVPEDLAEKLYHKIVDNHKSLSLPVPRLILDSLLLTPDGAMIAGFIDATGGLPQIRSQVIGVAHSMLGDLTSRPKNLLHATVGRFLQLPSDLSPDQKRAVSDLLRRYNTQRLPEMVRSIQQQSGGSFTLTELTMLRDVTWTLRQIREYGSWRL